MHTSATSPMLGKRLWFTRASGRLWLTVELDDGRAVGVPLSRYPTLMKASAAQRRRYRRIGRGDGFHWPSLDLDLSVQGIVEGKGEMTRRPLRRSA